MTRDELSGALERAVAAGIITPAQAAAVIDLEGGPATEPGGRPPRRVPPVLEALGYLGAIFVIVGAVTLVSGSWDDLATGGRLAVLGLAAAALSGAGLFVDDGRDRVLWRLRGFVELLASGAVAGFTALLVVDVLDVEGAAVALLIGGAVVAHSGWLWARRDRPAQHAATLVGAAVAVAGALAWAGAGAGGVGLAWWALGTAWLAASRRRVLPPAVVGTALGAALALAGAGVTSFHWTHAGTLFGLATAAGLVAAGIRLDEFVLTAVGVIGSFVFLPSTLGTFFGDTIGVPAVMLLSGLALLAFTALLLQRRSDGRRPSTGRWRRRHPRPAE